MKVGINCHKDYSHIMGNSQGLSHGDVTLVINGVTIEIPIGFYTKKGHLRKKYMSVVAKAILQARGNRRVVVAA